MKLGICYITADWPRDIDGLAMPRARRTLRFDITDKGFERGKQRFVSHDPHEIARACGALNVHATINWEKLEGQESAERITG
jgi:hypothetical protein